VTYFPSFAVPNLRDNAPNLKQKAQRKENSLLLVLKEGLKKGRPSGLPSWEIRYADKIS